MKKIHFIGICGKGMSAVAKLLIGSGLEVAGSDEGFYPPVSTYIEKNNIPFVKGYKKENIDTDTDTVVIGKHAKLTAEENEEVKYAFELQTQGKVQIKSFPEILKEITKDRETIVVAGSFGKSTCTALLSHLLEFNNLDIGYFIGATPITPVLNAHVGTHKNFVLEGDEYPSANWDKTSKFLYYGAQDVLLTAMAHDHINIFKTHEDFKKPFLELIKILPTEGNLVMSLDEETNESEFLNIKNLHGKTITYSVENKNADYIAKNILLGEKTTFEVWKGEENLGTLSTELLGIHNIQNILGVTALILEKALLSFDKIKKGLETFIAVEGRLNAMPTKSGFKVFEGFGSSVDKAKSAIDAVKLHFPNKKLKVIFEPHTFSWRNKEAISWYDSVFLKADKVYVYEPPSHGSHTITQLSQEEIVEAIVKSGVNCEKINDKEQAVEIILKEIDITNDIILTLTSADLGGIVTELATKL